MKKAELLREKRVFFESLEGSKVLRGFKDWGNQEVRKYAYRAARSSLVLAKFARKEIERLERLEY